MNISIYRSSPHQKLWYMDIQNGEIPVPHLIKFDTNKEVKEIFQYQAILVKKKER